MKTQKIIEQSLQTIFHDSTDYIGISYIDQKTKKATVFLNPAAYAVLGIPPGTDVSNMTSEDVFPDWAREIVLDEGIPQSIETGMWRGKIAIKTKKGKEIPVSIKITAHKNNIGKIQFFSIIARDIAEFRQKELETTLYEKTLYEYIPDAVIITDKNFGIQAWNKAAEKLYGWRKEEVLRKSASAIIPSKHLGKYTKKQAMHHLITQGEWKGEVIQKRKDNTIISVSVSMSTLNGKEGEIMGYIAINRDITENKKAEKRKDDFINMASHELKTPLTSFTIYAHALEKRLQRIKDLQVIHLVQKMTKQLGKLTLLVEELLDVTRIEKGEIALRKERFSLQKLLQETVKDFQLIAKQNLHIQSEGKQFISADEGRIRQVITNLLANAAKYSSHASDIVVSSKIKKGTVEISVKDFGIGIPRDQQQRIFERFYQVHEHRTYPGLGLGLYISSQIVSQHKGKMWVESTEGEGSTFYVTLPR